MSEKPIDFRLPWKVSDSHFRDAIKDEWGDSIAQFPMNLSDPRKVAIPPRVVACVNAMEGIDDPAAFVEASGRLVQTALYCADRLERTPSEVLHGGRQTIEKEDVRAVARKLAAASILDSGMPTTNPEKRIEALEDLLDGVKEDLPTRWVPCDECDGKGSGSAYAGETVNTGGGPVTSPETREVECESCDRGYVEIEFSDPGFEDALPIHPED